MSNGATRALTWAMKELKRLTSIETAALQNTGKDVVRSIRRDVDEKVHTDQDGKRKIEKAWEQGRVHRPRSQSPETALAIAEMRPGRHAPPEMAAGYIISLPRAVWKEFGTGVDAIIRTSPSLLRRIHDITREGWTIRYGPEHSGTQTIPELKRILIDPSRKGDPLQTAVAIAYESGHTIEPFKILKPGPLDDKEGWIEYHLDKIYKSEARAHWSLQQAQSESASRGGPLVGFGSPAYGRSIEEIYDAADGRMSDDAIGKISALMADGRVGDWHDPPPPTFADHYSKLLEKIWEKY
ncbi:hypothetical protein [Nocardia sp. CY41]|uniref:hypothetical protein n=1 Tax=Nocardia sp. CY41 TaxID=2608686 RepID=UPI0013598212|nr:hypothetical protein [Nocardia sp. CY41]